MSLRSVSSYTQELKSALPPETLQPARSRLLWLPLHLAIITLGTVGLAVGFVHGPLMAVVSLIIGCSFAGLTFLAHETLHGAVVRGRRLRRLVGTIGFLPFMIAPRLWIAWHNRVHHNHTNEAGVDPDAYPTLEEYRKRRVVRIVTDHLGPGRDRPLAMLSLLIGFTIQSGHMLFAARGNGLLSARQQRLALVESGLALAMWVLLCVAIGWQAWLFAFVFPLFVANAIVMGFILTNHSLSPLSDVNDPLFNSLSVTAPAWVEWLTLRFGYHVEHHLYPWMSSRHAPAVRALIRTHWPERYQSMPIWRALLALHRTGRVYKNATTLADLPGGKESPTLLPREVGALPLPLPGARSVVSPQPATAAPRIA